MLKILELFGGIGACSKALERLVDGYYQSNIKTSRNEDSVYAMKYASQQILIDKLEEENKSLQSQLKAKEEVIKEAREYVEKHRINNPYHYEYNCFMENARASDLLEILSKGENKWNYLNLK